MAGWNGSGVFSLPYNWTADAAAGIPITASRMDTQFATVATAGFGNTLTRDGQGQPSANLPMNGFKHTGVAVATADGEYVVYQQITSGGLNAQFVDLSATGNATIGGTVSVVGAANFDTVVSVSGKLFVAQPVVISTGNAPTSAGASGIIGSIAWDTSYIYVATANNTWKRAALSTF